MSDLEKLLGIDKLPPPVDRDARTLTDGGPVVDDHRDLKPNGQQKGYVVLSQAERAKGFVRPVRHSYIHEKCGTLTRMGQALAETYARGGGSVQFAVLNFTKAITNEIEGEADAIRARRVQAAVCP